MIFEENCNAKNFLIFEPSASLLLYTEIGRTRPFNRPPGLKGIEQKIVIIGNRAG